ncbi:MAG: prolipoprotein diacylglyceryl transferase [Bacteroidota bacterium]
MYPELFNIGPLTIYSYGMMLAIGFIIASYVFTSELKRKRIDHNIGGNVTLLAVVFGIIGSKIHYLIEHADKFIVKPSIAFSPGGLTFYGGLFLAFGVSYWYIKYRKKINVLKAMDSVAPALILGYGIARIGCHLAGDGDYGLPTELPWGTDYSRGTYLPSIAFLQVPEVANQFPGGTVPDTTLLHPTPMYEFLATILIFAFLWRIRKRTTPDGALFMVYLTAAGLERFLIEFIRINPRLMLGLSEAQLISVLVVGLGAYGILHLRKRKKGKAEVPN